MIWKAPPGFLVLTMLPILAGCSGHGSSVSPSLPEEKPPVAVPVAGEASESSNDYFVLGAYEMVFDPTEVSLEVRPLRNLDLFLDVTHFLLNVCKDCVHVQIKSWDKETGELVVDGQIRNPTNLTVTPPRAVFLFPDLTWKIKDKYCRGFTDHFYDGVGPLRDPFVFTRVFYFIIPTGYT